MYRKAGFIKYFFQELYAKYIFHDRHYILIKVTKRSIYCDFHTPRTHNVVDQIKEGNDSKLVVRNKDYKADVGEMKLDHKGESILCVRLCGE